jgi:porphobilinogen synthase
MVKPALPYLDIIARLRSGIGPADRGLPRERRVRDDQGGGRARLARRTRKCMTESLTSIARAGADMIFTYAALDYARWWRDELG